MDESSPAAIAESQALAELQRRKTGDAPWDMMVYVGANTPTLLAFGRVGIGLEHLGKWKRA